MQDRAPDSVRMGILVSFRHCTTCIVATHLAMGFRSGE